MRSETDSFGKTLYTQNTEADREVIEAVGVIADERGVSRATIALAWHFAKGMTAPTIGATKPGHIDAAVEALSVTLSNDELNRLEKPYRPKMPVGVVSTAPDFGQVTLKSSS